MGEREERGEEEGEGWFEMDVHLFVMAKSPVFGEPGVFFKAYTSINNNTFIAVEIRVPSSSSSRNHHVLMPVI